MAEIPKPSLVPINEPSSDVYPASLGATDTVIPNEDEYGDEWEYEYSATETETYYLTIDLSYPEFKSAAPPNPHHSRGGYYKKWGTQIQDAGEPSTAPGPSKPKPRPSAAPNPPPHQDNHENHDDNDDEPMPAADDDTAMIDPSLRIDDEAVAPRPTTQEPPAEAEAEAEVDQPSPNPEAEEEQQDPEPEVQEVEAEDLSPLRDIQVLDLHSPNPIIAYQGRVFEGQWAEMIGTDFILAKRDADPRKRLPALRNLPGNVDVLAASASRILTTKKTLQPKVPERDELDEIRQEWNIRIPSGKYKHSERAEQANFLERMIALKIKKGQTDHVTVYAKDGEGKDFQDHRDPHYRPRRKRTKIHEDSGENSAKGKRRIGRPPGSRVKRNLQTVRTDTQEPESEPSRPSRELRPSRGLSVPTPRQWTDLEQGNEDGDDEQNYDEDGQGSSGDDRRRFDAGPVGNDEYEDDDYEDPPDEDEQMAED